MNSPKSLSHFYDQTPPKTLNSCDRERIHLVNSVQGNAGLIALDPDTLNIIGHSTNLPALLGCPVETLLGRPVTQISDALESEVRSLDQNEPAVHTLLSYNVTHGEHQYDAISHLHNGVRFIEFLPRSATEAGDGRRKMRLCSQACALILRAPTWDEALQAAVGAFKDITGYARIKVYRFLSDWSGEVVAESREAHMPPYLGLHFPATDIPRQVREIMSIVPCRAITALDKENNQIVSTQPLGAEFDLTWSLSRSVSKMHSAYLGNMGIGASFSCSLMHRDRLWGVIVAHNADAEAIPYDDWYLLQEISASLMLRHEQEERVRTVEKITQLRRIENRFASAVRQDGDVEEAIHMLAPILQEFMGADGFAFQYGTNLCLSGRTPPRPFISKLVRWVIDEHGDDRQFQTNQLHREWEVAAEHLETACGVLVQPIMMHRVCQLIWFRGPVTRKIDWAGNPETKSEEINETTADIIYPRKSFDRWVQDHRDQSTAWEVSELETAKEIFTEFLDILSAQLLLKEENLTLRQFAEAAAHDMKAPLRGISMALEMMHEENFNEEVVKETHALAAGSARRLTMLTNGLLELAVIREQQHDFCRTDLGGVLEGVCEMLRAQLQECQAHVTLGPMPEINGNESLMLRLFLNLIGNAIKYRDPARPLAIDVRVIKETEQFATIAISDTGVGIPSDAAEQIFKPMKRLHAQDQVEGSGLGLTICERIVAIHQGSLALDTDYSEGARFVLRLNK